MPAARHMKSGTVAIVLFILEYFGIPWCVEEEQNTSAPTDVVGLELATVVVSLDSALGAVTSSELVEGINHLLAGQVAVGARDKESAVSRAHSSRSAAPTREVKVTRQDLTPSRITITWRQTAAEGRSCTGVRVLTTDEDEDIDNRHGKDEAANSELHFELSTSGIAMSLVAKMQLLRNALFEHCNRRKTWNLGWKLDKWTDELRLSTTGFILDGRLIYPPVQESHVIHEVLLFQEVLFFSQSAVIYEITMCQASPGV